MELRNVAFGNRFCMKCLEVNQVLSVEMCGDTSHFPMLLLL